MRFTTFSSTGLLSVLSIAALLAAAPPAFAQDVQVREYDENGLRYRETKRIVQRPVIEMKAQDQQRVVATPKLVSEFRKSDRLVYTPVVEYHWQPVMRNRFNPFVEPHYEYRLVPVTRWNARTETIEVPVQYQQTTTQTVTDRVLVPTTRMASEEYITREIVGAARGGAGGSVANLAKLDDPTMKRDGGAAPAKNDAGRGYK